MGARTWRPPDRRAAVYGDAEEPRAPGTWDREVWWALNRSALIGQAAGRHRWKSAPPFHYRDLYVTAGRPKLPYGMAGTKKAKLVHQPHTLLFAWRDGRLAGRTVAWHCGARTAYFRLLPAAPAGAPLCQMCVFQVRGRRAECGGEGDGEGPTAAVPEDGQGAVQGRDRGADGAGPDVGEGPG